VLAVCVGGGWAVAIIVTATPWTEQVSAEQAALLNGIGQVLAGALATYLGAQITTRARQDGEDDERDREA
jgi:hypothetical protein